MQFVYKIYYVNGIFVNIKQNRCQVQNKKNIKINLYINEKSYLRARVKEAVRPI